MVVITKSHCCDSQRVENGFIGNTVVTLRGTLTTFSITAVSVLVYVLFNNKESCMPCDINCRSQNHLKKRGAAVEIMSVHTDLHSHKIQSSVSTKFPGHCLQSELWFKYYVKRVSCWQKWNSNIGAISWDCIHVFNIHAGSTVFRNTLSGRLRGRLLFGHVKFAYRMNMTVPLWYPCDFLSHKQYSENNTNLSKRLSTHHHFFLGHTENFETQDRAKTRSHAVWTWLLRSQAVPHTDLPSEVTAAH